MPIQASPTPPHHLRETKEETKKQQQRERQKSLHHLWSLISRIETRGNCLHHRQGGQEHGHNQETTKRTSARRRKPLLKFEQERKPLHTNEGARTGSRPRPWPTNDEKQARKERILKKKGPEKPTTTLKKTTTTTNEVLQNPTFPFFVFLYFQVSACFFSFCNNKKNSQPFFIFLGEFLFNALVSPNCFFKKIKICFSTVQKFLYWKNAVWVFVFLFLLFWGKGERLE